MKVTRVRLQQRDNEIIEFLKNCKCADTFTIHSIFFKDCKIRTTQIRLQKLEEAGYIKSFREDILKPKIYYVRNKPKSYKHAIKVSQFIGELHKQNIEILKYKVPYKVGNIIADGLLVIRVNEDVKILFLEVELQKYFNLNKYNDLYYSRSWQEVFPVFPKIVVVSDKRVDTDKKFNIAKIDTEFKNIDDIIKV